MKKCPKCKTEKELSNFHIYKSGKIDSWCRSCKNEKSRLDRIEFRKENPRKKRIESDYLTDDGLVICASCNNKKPRCDFQKNRAGWCRQCRSELEARRRRDKGINERVFSEIIENKKLCPSCKLLLDFSLFYKDKNSATKLSSFCKSCVKEKFYNKDKAKESTKKYRSENRASYLAKHRIHQFKRRTKAIVTTDESITKEFIESIYEEKICYYCDKEIKKEKRTLEHKEPLSKGGKHTASNIVMACWTCNCSKRDLSELEFKKRLKPNGNS